jgi:hypothetical protein
MSKFSEYSEQIHYVDKVTLVFSPWLLILFDLRGEQYVLP